jgi:cytochrome c553
VRKLNEFRSGAKPATVMHQLAKGYTEQQIQQLAAYFAAQKR